jgi:hypothetical protein
MNDSRYPVSKEVALSLVMEHWSCFAGFASLLPEGRGKLATVLREVSVSVDHARAVAASFDDHYPTPSEIWARAEAKRDGFLPNPNRDEEWRKQGLTRDPVFGPELLGKMGQPDRYDQLRWQGIRAALAAVGDRKCDQKFWSAHLKWAEDHYPEEVAAIRAGREPQPPRKAPVMEIPFNRPPAPSNVITPADIAAAPKLDPKRCDICEGTGRVTDGYCNQCQLGRDLERVEKNSVSARIEPNYTGGRDGDSEFKGGGETG